MANLYSIKTSGYYDEKKVVAENMEEALHKYREHLKNSISVDYSSEEIFEKVTECKLIGEYQEEDIIK